MANNRGKDVPSQLIKRETQIEQNEIPSFAYHIGKSQRDNVQCQPQWECEF